MCVQDGACLFGVVKNNQLFLNAEGKMINKWWLELEKKFNPIELDEYVIMPNHIHVIGKKLDNHFYKYTNFNIKYISMLDNVKTAGAHTGAPLHDSNITVPQIVQWFKTMTTNEYIRKMKPYKWKPICGKLWQRGYYDRIIRNEQELWATRRYIINNPKNWRS